MDNPERPHAAAMTNPRADRVRDIAKLSGRSVRLRRRQFLAEGPQCVREALLAHRDSLQGGGKAVVTEVFASRECLDRHPEFADLAGSVTLRVASELVLEAMTDTVTPQGILAVCNFVDVPLTEVLERKPKLMAVLCQVRDPGNAGTVLRAADAAGADAVVLTASSVDIYNPKAVRSTAGSIFHLPIVLGAGAEETTELCRRSGMGILAADGYGSVNLDELQDQSAARRLGVAAVPGPYNLADRTVWLFGNEAQGLSDGELALADHRVAVPVYGSAESLNLGTAATVCLYGSARSQLPGQESRGAFN